MRKSAVLFLCLVLSGVANAVPEDAGLESKPQSGAEMPDQSVEARKDELLGLLAQVDERYGDVAASLKSIEKQIEKTSESLAKLRKEVTSYQAQINRLELELAGQVKAAYAMGQKDRLKLLLNQQDPALSSRMMVYYQYLNKSRLEKLQKYQQTVRYLGRLEQDKQTETALLANHMSQKKTEQNALETVKRQRDSLLAKLNGNLASKQEQLSFLQESENKLINLIQTLENDERRVEQQAEAEQAGAGENVPEQSFPKVKGDFNSLKGKLPLPVRGKVGNMHGTESGSGWKGVLINAQEGVEVRAITGGTVAYSGALKGYGLLLIVAHDKNFMTLYAFNQSLLKRKDDTVEAGDVIATVGQSGGRSKPGLYFEIRHDGKPVDPLLWCRN
jgi:murein hydrolase activator